MLATSLVGVPVILSGHSTSSVRTRRIRAQNMLQTTQRVMTAASSTASAAAVRKSTYARGVDIFTHTDQVDTALLAVSARAAAWAQVGLDEKIAMLKAMKCRMIKCSMQIGGANAVVRLTAAWHCCIVTKNVLSSCGTTAKDVCSTMTGYIMDCVEASG